MWTPPSSNLNFPAPLAVMAFLVTAAGAFLALASAAIAWFARKTKLARAFLLAVFAGAAVYAGLLFGFSLARPPHLLPRLLPSRCKDRTRRRCQSLLSHHPHPLRRNHHLTLAPQRRTANSKPPHRPPFRFLWPRIPARSRARHAPANAPEAR
jgi:hypothetical protein